MESSLHNIDDLPEPARTALEGIVGHPLRKGDVLYIAMIGMETAPEADDRQKAWLELQSIVAESQANAKASGLPPEQIDRLIEHESAAVRHDRGA